jgi:hypothetical protein
MKTISRPDIRCRGGRQSGCLAASGGAKRRREPREVRSACFPRQPDASQPGAGASRGYLRISHGVAGEDRRHRGEEAIQDGRRAIHRRIVDEDGGHLRRLPRDHVSLRLHSQKRQRAGGHGPGTRRRRRRAGGALRGRRDDRRRHIRLRRLRRHDRQGPRRDPLAGPRPVAYRSSWPSRARPHSWSVGTAAASPFQEP